jgi:site-specific recombinase XerD
MLKTLTKEEQERVLEVALKKSIREHAIVKIVLYTGLRVSELVGLTWDDMLICNEIKRTLVVRAEIAKRARPREIPLSSAIQKTLAEYVGWVVARFGPYDTSWPFFTQLHKPRKLTPRQVQRLIKDIGTAALGRRIHPHLLRHTFATNLLKVTNIRVVQELLGHKNISTTEIYTHPTMSDAQQAVDQLELNGIKLNTPHNL